jgi:CRP-like cAMP-binding protein
MISHTIVGELDGLAVKQSTVGLDVAEPRALRPIVECGSRGDVAPVAVAAAVPPWRSVAFAKAERIYAEGDTADRLYIITSGAVKLSRTSPSGRTVLTILGPQEMFDMSSVFDPGPRMATATALSEVRAASLDHRTIRSMIPEHSQLAEQFLQILARRLKRTNDDLTDLVFTDGPGRVAKRLLELARPIRLPGEEAGALRIAHNLTQVEIAQLSGVSRETVNKSMSDFTRRGWIAIDGPSVVIRNPELLARRAR